MNRFPTNYEAYMASRAYATGNPVLDFFHDAGKSINDTLFGASNAVQNAFGGGTKPTPPQIDIPQMTPEAKAAFDKLPPIPANKINTVQGTFQRTPLPFPTASGGGGGGGGNDDWMKGICDQFTKIGIPCDFGGVPTAMIVGLGAGLVILLLVLKR